MKTGKRIAAVIAAAVCIFTTGAVGCGSDSAGEKDNSVSTQASSAAESAESTENAVSS